MRVVVVGAGVFGLTAALELEARGAEVTVVAPAPWPHPDASSTDISKLVRMDYGTDPLYTGLMEEALDGWIAWNKAFDRPLFHEEGVLVLCKALAPGSFEGDSQRFLEGRGHPLVDVDPALLGSLPGWRGFDAGYLNPRGGWAESGAAVSQLAGWVRDRGIRAVEGSVRALRGTERVVGVDTDSAQLDADHVVLAVGAWLPSLLPELADRVRPVGQPVLHFAPSEPARWRAPAFPPWAGDVGNTGWYGFPANADGLVKVANHGAGVVTDPTGPRSVDPSWEKRCRAFLREHLPDLAEAMLVGTRLCLYADSFDGDFWIANHPKRDGLSVAGGGSGHGFKFAPLLGRLVADTVEGRGVPRFAWRELGLRRSEAARAGDVS